MASYPANFGGIVGNADGSISIVEVGKSAAFELSAQQQYANIHSANGAALPVADRQARFLVGSVPFKTLYDANTVIQAQVRDLNAQSSSTSPAIWSVGINDAEGKIVVGEDGSSNALTLLNQYEEQYGPTLFDPKVGPAPKGADVSRYSDTPPWNGGDDLTNSAYGNGCTSGYPIHNSAGATFLLTAGHCGSGSFYNTDYTSPSYSSGDYVGQTIWGSLSVSNMDEQILSDTGNSSCIVWGGVSSNNSNDVRYYNEGYANPPVNQLVYYEGAQGHERQGNVIAYNVQVTYHTDLYGNITEVGTDETSMAPIPGDSGGPTVYASIYGPFAGGTILASNGTNGWFQLIGGIVYLYSLQYNTSMTPNYINGSGCVN